MIERMIDVEALFAQRSSTFELVLESRFRRRPPRHSVEFIPPHPDVAYVVEAARHGRGTAPAPSSPADEALSLAEDAVSAEVASFAGLLERGAGHLAAARAAHRRQCREAAELVRALAAFAAARPAAVLDRPDGEVGAAATASRAARPAVLTKVSEWAVDEVMVALGLSSGAAAGLLAESVSLVDQLPATLAALETGTVSWAHARMLVEVLAPLTDDATRAEVEARLLAGAAGRTVAQLRVTARRAVLRADAAAATRRLALAIRERQVRVFPGADGMASLVATLPVPVAVACRNALEQYAQACAAPGDDRTRDQRMTDCLADLLLRPGETGLPPVQAQLTVVAAVDTLRGGDEPGEIDGHPVPAALVRELAHALGLLPRPSTALSAVAGAAETELGARQPTESTRTAPATSELPAPEGAGSTEPTQIQPAPTKAPAKVPTPTGTTPSATTADEAAPAGEEALVPPADGDTPQLSGGEAAAARLAALLGLTTVAGTALAHLPTIAVVEEISGQLLALTTGAGIRAAVTCSRRACRTGKRPCTHPPDGPCLGPPEEIPGYRPSAPLERFVAARDRRCRFPGCRAPAIRCDLDHNTPWPTGPTSADNLCCLCRHHHRLSHQAPGWTMRRLPGGGLEWTTPSGDRITTHPPRYGTDDHPPPNSERAAAHGTSPPPLDPPLTLRESVLGRPDPPGTTSDPAPF